MSAFQNTDRDPVLVSACRTPIGKIRGALSAVRPDDLLALKALRKACTDKDWEFGGSDLSERPLAGQFSDNVLTAIASYVIWAGDIAHISVVTHPDFRGLGYGKGVVSAITEVAISRALIPQYRTLLANTASMGIAQSLGFRHHATSLAVRTSNAAG